MSVSQFKAIYPLPVMLRFTCVLKIQYNASESVNSQLS